MILILGVKLIHLYTLYINIKNIKIYRTYIPFTRQHKNENYRDIEKGCSDLGDLIVDRTIDIEDFDKDFPIENFFIFTES